MKKTNILKLFILAMAFLTLAGAVVWFPRLMAATAETPPILLVLQGGFFLRLLPLFIGLHQAWKVLNLLEKGNAFSLEVVRALRNIKYCANSVLIMYAIGIAIMAANNMTDFASVINAGEVTFKAGVLSLFSAVFQELIQNAYDIKTENDLTV